MCDPCIVIEISQQESKTKQQDVPIKKCNQDDSDSQGKSFSTDTATTPHILCRRL